MKTIGVIPARYASTRLPAKVLAPICGKPLIQHVYESARRAGSLETILVATDDPRVVDAVQRFGGTAVFTSAEHRSGSDRIAEAVGAFACDIVVNIQGDEPLIRPEAIDAAVQPLLEDPSLNVATIAVPCSDAALAEDPNVVKVVTALDGTALYFSRAPIPHLRDGGAWRYLKHIGLYAYRKEFLLRFTRWPATPLEQAEKLEQLRILEHGERIRVITTAYDSPSVDTPSDLARVQRMIEQRA
ncbi:MAG: 3-deoxy-manno-octulosonate cytidylyltransferase [Candidatus Aureabacteria bacterium]|nr:3-deoxy-manno-octulosonate cytidylyltransferase [Candidatus Auribacterota bacterium]